PDLSGTILVNALPDAAFTNSAPRCETRVISFSDASTANVGVLDLWTWDFGDASPGSALQNPTHVYAVAGAYTVTLTVRNSKGCISNPISSAVINIDNRPLAGFIIPEVCLNDSYAQFIDTSKLSNAAINNWEWNFGDPGSGALNTSTLQNPTHSYAAVGNYDVRLIVWNDVKGCRDTIIQPLFINGSFPVAGFNVNNPAALCANDSVGIAEASTVFPGSISKIEIYWDNVNAPGVFQTDNSPFTGKIYKHLYANFQTPLTKTFTIRYRAYSGGVCVNDKLDNIIVHAAPLVQFNNMPDTCLLVTPFQLTQASEIGAVPGTGVYSGPGVSASGIFDPQAAGVGTHTITYTFTSTAAGCVDYKTNTITVLDTAHAAFSFVSPSCEQLPTSFTDISTAPPTVTINNTVWDFGDLTPVENHAPGSTFGHLFPAPGTYTVTMYNESAAGCRSTAISRQVTIDPNHSISLTSANNIQTRCINNSIAPILYNLAGGATGVTITNLPPGVSYTVTGNTVTISGAPTSTLNSPYNFSIQT
ncbi:MAG: PKD domain-containing protein, partial [Ferruginibacter sp.]